MRRVTIFVGCVTLLAVVTSQAQAKPFYYFLNTENGQAPGGRIDGVDFAGITRTVGLADVAPSPFSSISAWKGFATEGKYYYFLNTEGGAAFRGKIDRINLDGTGRTTVLDVDPSLFTNIGDHKGFATDGAFFYFLNTEQAGAPRGTISRVRMDGGGLTTLLDVQSPPFGSIFDWKGFATDGKFFYFLNTDGGAAWPGRIDRMAMTGGPRTQMADVDPSLFSNISDWKGFAVASAIPEPSALLVWTLGLLGVVWYRRRRRQG